MTSKPLLQTQTAFSVTKIWNAKQNLQFLFIHVKQNIWEMEIMSQLTLGTPTVALCVSEHDAVCERGLGQGEETVK